MDIPSSDVMVTIALLSHWLCYANSAVNPVIYNFMSGKFRREFKRTFLQSRCLYRNPSSPQSRHFNTRDKYQVSTASEYPMTTTVHPGSASTTMLRGECFLPTSGGSSMRQPGRRLLSNNNETSSSRL
ncbi:hypothetical protein C0J52_09634 [Blattella germanica]|nr:hypothetical protein C0J52_09634 [Blattella germanica]